MSDMLGLPMVPKDDCFGCAELLGVPTEHADAIFCAKGYLDVMATATPLLGATERLDDLCDATRIVIGATHNLRPTKPATEARNWALHIPPTLPLGGSFVKVAKEAYRTLAASNNGLGLTPSDGILAADLAVTIGMLTADTEMLAEAREHYTVAADRVAKKRRDTPAEVSGNYRLAVHGLANCDIVETHLDAVRGATEKATNERYAEILGGGIFDLAQGIVDFVGTVDGEPSDMKSAISEIVTHTDIMSRVIRNGDAGRVYAVYAPSYLDGTNNTHVFDPDTGRQLKSSVDIEVVWGGASPVEVGLIQVKSIDPANGKGPRYEYPINTVIMHGTSGEYFDHLNDTIAGLTDYSGSHLLGDYMEGLAPIRVPNYDTLARMPMISY